MSRIALADIPSLIFYKDRRTASRRGAPIPQLTCIGKPCALYQPDVVHCKNIGGDDVDIHWTCEADLPESLRFGAVEVSCEGWDGPGDPYVLRGSCGLEYRLVQVPSSLRRPGYDDPSYPSRLSRWLNDLSQDPTGAVFMFLWLALLAFLLYTFLSSCLLGSRPSTPTNTPRRPWWRPSPGAGWFSGSGPGPDTPGPHDPPPPYTKYAPSSTSAPGAEQGWRPGFWTGAALGGLGAYLFSRGRDRARPRPLYDWEAERVFAARPVRPVPPSSGFWGSARPRPRAGWDDRGEGPSGLGSMRRSTGFGGSSVR